MLKLLLVAQLQIAATAGADLEIWPLASRESFQHRMLGEAEITISLNRIVVRPRLSIIWWGDRNAKIPGSFLNLEATKILERQHGVDVLLRLGPCAAGAWAGRRGVEWLGKNRHWGEGAIKELEKGPPWPTIGYYDGITPMAECYGISVRGPLIRYHKLTLPWPNWFMDAEYMLGKWHFLAHLTAGGIRRSTAFDVSTDYHLSNRFHLGLRYGHIEYPGFEKPLKRTAVLVEIH